LRSEWGAEIREKRFSLDQVKNTGAQHPSPNPKTVSQSSEPDASDVVFFGYSRLAIEITPLIIGDSGVS
jgi:hypothetical protein